MRIRLTALLALTACAGFVPAAHASWTAPYHLAYSAASPRPVVGADGTWAFAGVEPVDVKRGRVRVVLRRGALTRILKLTLHTGAVDSADVALDAHGHAVAVWSQGHRIGAARCTTAGCGPARVVGKVGHAHGEPRVVVHGQRALVLWRGIAHGGVTRLKWAEAQPGKRFGHVHTLGEFGFETALAIDAKGRVTAVWTGDHLDLRSATRTRGEFSRPRTVARGPASNVALAAVPSGQAVLVWRHAYGFSEGEAPLGPIYVSTRPPGERFSVPRLVSSAAARSVGTSAALAPDGHGVVAWVEPARMDVADPPYTLSAALLAPDGMATQPSVLSRSSLGLATAITDSGRSAVAWEEGSYSTGYATRAAVAEPGATFGASEPVPADPNRGFALTAFAHTQLVFTWTTTADTWASYFAPPVDGPLGRP